LFQRLRTSLALREVVFPMTHALVGYRWRNIRLHPNSLVVTITYATSCRKPGRKGALLRPSPLRTVRASLPAHGSSFSNALKARRGSPRLNLVVPSRYWPAATKPDELDQGRTKGIYPSSSAFPCQGGLFDGLAMRHPMEVCPLSCGVMSLVRSTPIHTITVRLSLAPFSHPRRPISVPCGSLSLTGDLRVYHVPHK